MSRVGRPGKKAGAIAYPALLWSLRRPGDTCGFGLRAAGASETVAISFASQLLTMAAVTRLMMLIHCA